MTDQLTPQQMAAQLHAAKLAEDTAKAHRVELENMLAQAIGYELDSSKTHKLDGFKVTIKAPVSIKLDVDEWNAIKDSIPEAMRPVKMVEKLEPKGVKYLKNNEPDTYAIVARALTETPGKVAVSVTETTKEGK